MAVAERRGAKSLTVEREVHCRSLTKRERSPLATREGCLVKSLHAHEAGSAHCPCCSNHQLHGACSAVGGHRRVT